MFKRKDKDTSPKDKELQCKVPSDFRAEYNRVISQIHARSATHDDSDLGGTLGRLRRLEGPREMEVICVKNAIRKGDPMPAGVGLHFGSILGYSTDQASHRRVDIGEGRSDFSEMKRRLEQNLNQSCRFKQHAKLERSEEKPSDTIGSDSHSDSDSARGRSASSSGSCHSPAGSLCGSASDCETEQLDQQELDEFMLDKFAHECKISLSTASVMVKPTVIEIDTPLKENVRDEEFIEAQNDMMSMEKVSDEELSPDGEKKEADHIYEDVAEVRAREEAAQASAVSSWLAKRGIVLEEHDLPKVVQSTPSDEPVEDEIKVVKRRFIKYDPKSRRRVEPVLSISTDSQYSSDESTNAVKNPDMSECSASETSEASESRDTVILGGGDLLLGVDSVDGVSNVPTLSACRVSASISSRDERPETPSPARTTTPTVEPVQTPIPVEEQPIIAPSPVLRPKRSFKAIRASYDKHAAVEEELIEMLPSVRRLASKFHFEGDGIDWKNKYHSLTGRSLSKEFRQKQLQAKPSLPRTARFHDATAVTIDRRPTRGHLNNIREMVVDHAQPASLPVQSELLAVTHREIETQTSPVESGSKKKKKQRSKSQPNKKGFFDREILARLSKFQQYI